MELNLNFQKIKNAKRKLGKYKYALLAVLLGVGILLLPSGGQEQAASDTQQSVLSAQEEKQSLQTQLAEILSDMDGVGSTRVLLSLQSGVQSVYWQDAQSEQELQTVYTQSGNEKTPALSKQLYPIYRGAVVVCEGADSAQVTLSVKQAVAGLTGLRSDQITVAKMKVQ